MSITFKRMIKFCEVYICAVPLSNLIISIVSANVAPYIIWTFIDLYIYIFLDKSFDLDLKDDLYFKVMESLINLMLWTKMEGFKLLTSPLFLCGPTNLLLPYMALLIHYWTFCCCCFLLIWKCNFPVSPLVRLSISRLVGLS